MTLRVMTWNLWWRFGDHERREAAIIDVLRREAPDIVCLQEVWASRDDGQPDDVHGHDAGREETQADRLAGALEMHACMTQHAWSDGLAFGNAVLSRWPVGTVVDEPLPRPDGRNGHRRLLLVLVDSPWGPWPVITTHLDHRFDASATRRRQLDRVMDLAVEHRGEPEHDLPLVLGGDLNAVPDSDEVRMATGRSAGAPSGMVFSDVWEQVGDGDGATWRRDNPHVGDSAWPDRRIDQLMVSWPRPKPIGNPARAWLAGHRPIELDGELVWPSDHAAVVAELRTP